jgi:hypothetical protein
VIKRRAGCACKLWSSRDLVSSGSRRVALDRAIALLARTDDVTECYGREPRMPNVMPTGFPVRLRPELDPMYPMHRNEEYANDLDNPDPRRDLHRTRDQRLSAGRVLISEQIS